MCRVILFAKADNIHPDPELEWTKLKRGDVVEILEDGQHAGNSVEGDPLFHIVEVPGVPAKDMFGLLATDDDHTLEGYRRIKINQIDIDALPKRKLTRAELLKHRHIKPRIPRSEDR